MVEKATLAVVPGGMRTVRLRLITGSSTEPTVLESGRPSTTDTGLRASCPRPIKRERSVSNCNSPTVSPSTATGVVLFYVDSEIVAGTTLTSGRATYTVSSLAAGSHTISATYNGDTNDNGSTSNTIVQTVN